MVKKQMRLYLVILKSSLAQTKKYLFHIIASGLQLQLSEIG